MTPQLHDTDFVAFRATVDGCYRRAAEVGGEQIWRRLAPSRLREPGEGR